MPPASEPSQTVRGAWLRWVPLVAPLAVALVVLGFHVAPLWRDVTSWAGQWDCRYFWFVIEVDRVTISEYGQLPLWNPYYCGGAPHLANPQATPLSPLTLVILLLGTPVGYRLGYTLGLLTALLALRAFARTLGMSEAAATLAGAGYAVSGAFAQHMGGGHWAWMGFALHPLLLRSLYLVVAGGRRDHLVWGALALAVIVMHAPIYPMAFGLVVVGVYALMLGLGGGVRDWRRLLAAVGAAAAMCALGLALGAVRLLPIAALVAAHPRKVDDWDFTWPHELVETYALRHTARAFGKHQYVFPEYGNYFGLGGVALMLAGLVVVLRWRRALWPVAAGAVIFVLFQLGHLIPLPWWALKKLPVYAGLRVPSRFTIVAGMFMCLLIGAAYDRWGAPALGPSRRSLPARRRWLGWGVTALAVAYLFDASSFNRLQWGQTIGSPPPRELRAPRFRQVPGDRGRMMAFPRANLGTLDCFEETPLPKSPRLRGNLPVEEYLADPAAGVVRRVAWSPNRIELEVRAYRASTVLVNQNFDPGWRVEGAAGPATSVDGLLAAPVADGVHRVTFVYRPRPFVVGGAISLAALAVAVAAAWRWRRRRPAVTSAPEPPVAGASGAPAPDRPAPPAATAT